MSKEFLLVADYRENFINSMSGTFNDHPKRESIEEFRNAAIDCGYNCSIFGGVNEIIRAKNNNQKFTNAIFVNMSDGLYQKNARIQVPVCCELLGVPYSGSDPFTVALVSNKHYCKMAVNSLGVFTPHGALVIRNSVIMPDFNDFTFPMIIKPNTEGSSVGIDSNSIVFCKEDAIKQIEYLFHFFEEVIVEEYIAGYEITNLLIGNNGSFCFNEVIITKMNQNIFYNREVLGINEKRNKTYINDYACNYIPITFVNKISRISENIFSGLNMHDIVRIDYRVTEKGDVFFLEANSVPRISQSTQAGLICSHHGLTYSSFVGKYLETIEKRLIVNHE